MKAVLLGGYAAVVFYAVLLVPIAKAENAINLSQMEQEIYLEPWRSYQKIIGLTEQSNTFNGIDHLWWLLRKAQTENLLYFYKDFAATVEHAQTLITRDTPIEIQSQLNVFQGLVHQRNGLYSKAELVLNKAIAQATSANLPHLAIFAKQELAYTKSLTELFEIALEDIQQAYVEAFALNDQFLIAVINETYGAIYGYLDDYQKSIEYYQRALTSYERLKYKSHIAEATFGLASTYRDWKKYDLAIEHFRHYQQKISYIPNAKNTFFAAYGLGMTLAEKGDCPAALEVIAQALILDGQADYNAELYKRQSSCFIILGQLDAAEEAIFNAALEFSKIPEIIGTTWQLEVIKISGELAHARKEYDLGYQMLEQYYQKYTQLLKNNSTNRLLKVRARLEVERQQIVHALAQQSAALEQEKLRHLEVQQFYINIFIGGLVILAVIVIFVQYRNNTSMRLLTIKDSLSNLYNRRYVFDYLNKVVDSAAVDKTQLAVMIIDIDEFKHINDKYGHPVGDNVIKQIAKLGLAVLRHEDVMGRIGGEEFLCVLPRTDAQEAMLVANRLISAVNHKKMLRGIDEIITVSIGIACFSKSCQDVNQLYINADHALYQAKNKGKNQAKLFD